MTLLRQSSRGVKLTAVLVHIAHVEAERRARSRGGSRPRLSTGSGGSSRSRSLLLLVLLLDSLDVSRVDGDGGWMSGRCRRRGVGSRGSKDAVEG